jgi:hypothetical protein
MAESGGGGGGVEDAGCLPPSHTNNGGDGAGNLPPSHANGGGDGAGSTWEIEELEEPDDRPPRSVAVAAASTASSGADDDVYVAVGKGGSSMAALSWALRRLTKPRSFVYLVHVFPVVTSIPTPCEPSTTVLDFDWSLSSSTQFSWPSSSYVTSSSFLVV